LRTPSYRSAVLILTLGTNTYLVGQTNPFILIDAAEGREAYIPVLEEALTSAHTSPELPEIGDIILTHRHHDHVDGLPSVLSLLQRRWASRHGGAITSFPAPRIHKFPLDHPRVQAVLDAIPSELYSPNPADGILHALTEGQRFPVTTTAGAVTSGMSLEVVHTPGHTPDSICIYFPADRALFTADTILGQSSTVFENLRLYMVALQKLLAFNGEGASRKYDTLYPGHGPTVPHDHVGMYLQHRVDRENQVLQAIRSTPSEGENWTTWTLVRNIYAKYPQELWEPAAYSVDQHLTKLEEEGIVAKVGGEERHTQWKLQ
jgi:endoribonuclease LACTB2